MTKTIQTPVSPRSDIRRAVQHLHKISNKMQATEIHYRLDRLHLSNYLRGFPMSQKLIRDYLDELRKQGEEIAYADVCGRVQAKEFGATVNYSFSLQNPDKRFLFPSDCTLIQGDVFKAKDFNSFINLIKKNGHKLALATFEPCAGLQSYTPSISSEESNQLLYSVTFQRLKNNLKKIMEAMRPGGFIWIEEPFQLLKIKDVFLPFEETELYIGIKKFAEKNKYSMRVDRCLAPRFLLRNRRRK